MARVHQALIAAGGQAARMKNYSGAKSLIYFDEQPLLFWNLRNLQSAGITDFIVATTSEDVANFVKAYQTEHSGVNIRLFMDEGLGVHGLPSQVFGWLDPEFLFDAGHSVLPPAHYVELLKRGNFSWTGSRDLTNGTRYQTQLDQNTSRHTVSLGLPMVLPRDEYCNLIERHNYKISRVLDELVDGGKLNIVVSEHPLEFDTDEEMKNVKKVFLHGGLV